MTRSGTSSTSQRAEAAPEGRVGRVGDRQLRRPSATARNPGSAARAPCRGRSAATPAPPVPASLLSSALSSTVAPGLTPCTGLTRGDRRQLVPALRRRRLVAGDLRHRVVGAGARRLDRKFRRQCVGPVARGCRASTGSTSATGVPAQPPSANDRRPPSISRPPPRLPTKSAIIRSWSGENEAASTLPRMMRAIREQLVARLRESVRRARRGLPTSSRRYLSSAVRCRMHDLQVLVVFDRAPDELRLESRLALEVQDLLAAVAHLDERFARVVLRDLFVGLQRRS